MGKDHEPCYISPRLVGQLYRLVSLILEILREKVCKLIKYVKCFRRIKAVDDVFDLTDNSTSQDKIVPDSDLIVDGWEEYEAGARIERDKYCAGIRVRIY